ncbi:SIR2 family protein [Nocardia sp. NPDC005366]|uniref:SIR2 family protein n=1 Tax=Nocardia sp. NPDC005366 TaxID=3156878 RepID=UPI0033AD3CDF
MGLRDAEIGSLLRRLDFDPVGYLSSQVAYAPVGECPYVLMIGAGASVSSGVLTASELIARWCEDLFAHDNGYPTGGILEFPRPEFDEWLRESYPGRLEELKIRYGGDSEYGTLFQHFHKTREQRQMFVERSIETSKPGVGYFYLAGLIDSGYFSTVLTTNFDDLLNDALVRYFDRKSIVCAFDSAVTSFSSSSLRPKIIKLHGDFLYDSIGNTDAETLDLNSNMEDKLAEMCEDKGLIVVGYSGNDESVMTLLRDNLRRNRKFLTKGIHWCVNEVPREGGTIEQGLSAGITNLAKRHGGRVFLYRSSGFDDLMLQFFEKAGLSLPKHLERPYTRNLAMDFINACGAFEVSSTLSSGMLRHKKIALASLDGAPDRQAIQLAKAKSEFETGKSLQRLRKNAEAAECFERSVELANVLLDEDMASIARWGAINRIMSCNLSLGTLESSVEARLARFKLAFDLGIEQLKSRPDGDKSEYASLLYNTICACGLMYAHAESELRAELDGHVERMAARLVSIDFGRRKMNKLAQDTDVRLLLTDGPLRKFV